MRAWRYRIFWTTGLSEPRQNEMMFVDLFADEQGDVNVPLAHDPGNPLPTDAPNLGGIDEPIFYWVEVQ
ncbi:MAG: hypothetical protein ACFB21_06585 [Opitutales bacterium]